MAAPVAKTTRFRFPSQKSTFFWQQQKSTFKQKIDFFCPKKSTFSILKLLDKKKIQAGLKYLVSTNVIQLWIDQSKNQENTISNILTKTSKSQFKFQLFCRVSKSVIGNYNFGTWRHLFETYYSTQKFVLILKSQLGFG